MTRALIIVESCFGNTRAIADSIAAGLIDGGVDAQVVDIDEAPSSLPADLDLLMLGAPTHNRGLPTTATRAKAHAQAGADGASQGISQWLGTAEIPASLSTANKGPLAAGQESDARSWGRELAGSANTGQ